jgi:glutaredoxin
MKTVYTKDNCPACEQVKAVFKRDNIEFKEIKIGRDISREDFITKYPTIKRVPFTVVDDNANSV